MLLTNTLQSDANFIDNMQKKRQISCHILFPTFYISFQSLQLRSIFHWMTLIFAVCLFVGCLMSQQHASISQGRICSDNCTCCHTEIEVADQTFYLTQSQYTETRSASPNPDPIKSGAWQTPQPLGQRGRQFLQELTVEQYPAKENGVTSFLKGTSLRQWCITEAF